MTHGAKTHEVAGLTWDQVGQRLAGGAAAILPIGAGAKQHGLHMKMATDRVFAEYFSRALAERIDALIWPTLTYGAYPAFVAYAGAHADEMETSLMLAIAPELVDMVRAAPCPFSPTGPSPGALSPDDPSSPTYSPSGSFGDPTLASADKGSRLLAAILADRGCGLRPWPGRSSRR
jgi:creatinine amidohydrolase/Fe(II)-dependent formamide hydrolase-like protein